MLCSLLRYQASQTNVSAVAAVPARPNICNRCVRLMREQDRGRKTRTSFKCSERGSERRNSSLHCSYLIFPYLTWLPACFPSPLHRRPPGRGAGPRRPSPGPAAPEDSLGRAGPPREEGERLRDAPRGAGRGRGRRRGQSAGEAAAGPRLAGPGGSNLRGLSLGPLSHCIP